MPSIMIRAASAGWVCGMRDCDAAASAGHLDPEFCVIPVATAPGMITDTLTWLSSSSAYRPSVNNLTAALLAP